MDEMSVQQRISSGIIWLLKQCSISWLKADKKSSSNKGHLYVINSCSLWLGNAEFWQKRIWQKIISPFLDEGVVPGPLSRPPSVSCSNFEPLMIWLRCPCVSPEVKRNYELPVLNFFSSSRDFVFLQFISFAKKQQSDTIIIR